jgi:potassium/hydrogen antiporter
VHFLRLRNPNSYISRTPIIPRMVDFSAADIFILAGVTIITGYIASFLFRRYKAPDILILMLLGWIFGTWALDALGGGVSEVINTLLPYVSSLALAFIMFNGGLEISLKDIGNAGKEAGYLAFSMFLLVVIGLSAFFWLIGLPPVMAILCGVVFGSSSAPTVIPLISSMGASTRIKTTLILESAITDVMVVGIGTAFIVSLAHPGSSFTESSLALLGSMIIALVIGLGTGVVWVHLSPKLSKYQYYYLLTLALILLLYGVCDIIVPDGGAVIAVLIFGLVLGNSKHLPARLRSKDEVVVKGKEFTVLNEELAFFIKVFFFTFLGIYVATLNFSWELILYGIAVFLILLGVRQYVTHLMKRRQIYLGSEEVAMRSMFPRGLTTVVVSLLIFSYGVEGDLSQDTLLGIVAIVIVATTMLTSVGAFLVEKQLKVEGAGKREEGKEPPRMNMAKENS